MNMNVLLVQPPQVISDAYKDPKRMIWTTPPLGISYIAAVLKKNNYNVKIHDGQLTDNVDFSNMIKLIEEFKPEVIGMTSVTPTFHGAISAAKAIKENFSNIKIVLGGPHAIALPRETLEKHQEFDFTVTGEGEYTMLDLVQHLEKGRDLSDVKGIAYRKKGNVILNEPRPLIQNLDELPLPARHLLPDLKSYNYVNYKRWPTAHMITGRGCPNMCIFCDHPFGRGNRTHSVDRVISEIKHLKEKYGIKDIQFHDENLMLNKKRLSEICDRIIQENIDITWSCLARAENADIELFKKMKKAGCWVISFGIETGNQEVLDFIKKGTTLEVIKRAVFAAKKAGIKTRGSFMLGHPTDTKETIMQTIKFAKSLKLDHASFALTVPYPGSELYKIADQYGTFRKEDYSSYKRQPTGHPVFVPNTITEKELIELHKRVRVEMYFKSTYIFREMKYALTNWNEFKKYFFGAMGVIKTDVLNIKN